MRSTNAKKVSFFLKEADLLGFEEALSDFEWVSMRLFLIVIIKSKIVRVKIREIVINEIGECAILYEMVREEERRISPETSIN